MRKYYNQGCILTPNEQRDAGQMSKRETAGADKGPDVNKMNKVNIVNKKKPLKYIIYAISLCLIICYISILAISIHPQITIMYYLSYIDSVKTITDMDHREELKECLDGSRVEYQIGTEEILTYSQLPEDRYGRIASGWGVPSEEGVWCIPEGGYLFYKLDELDRNKDILLRLNIFSFDGYEDVLVSANGLEVGRLEPQTGNCQITIPAKSLQDAYLYLYFQPEKTDGYEGDMSFCLTTASLHQ